LPIEVASELDGERLGTRRGSDEHGDAFFGVLDLCRRQPKGQIDFIKLREARRVAYLSVRSVSRALELVLVDGVDGADRSGDGDDRGEHVGW
jgi:hypothetical protein